MIFENFGVEIKDLQYPIWTKNLFSDNSLV